MSRTKDYLLIAGFISLPFIAIYTITCLFSWGFHANDKATLIVFPMHIASRTEEYNNIMEQTKMLDEGETQFRMNSDNPVAALVDARDKAARRLRDTKANQAHVLANIISRCNGPWKIVVMAVDTVTCKQYEAMKF